MTKPNRDVDQIYLDALAQSTPEERATFLDKACAQDTILRQRVERLLAAQPKAANFLEQPAAEVLATQIPTITDT